MYFLKNHNCIRELKKIIDDQQTKINHLSNEMVKQKTDVENELRILKVNISAWNFIYIYIKQLNKFEFELHLEFRFPIF